MTQSKRPTQSHETNKRTRTRRTNDDITSHKHDLFRCVTRVVKATGSIGAPPQKTRKEFGANQLQADLASNEAIEWWVNKMFTTTKREDILKEGIPAYISDTDARTTIA